MNFLQGYSVAELKFDTLIIATCRIRGEKERTADIPAFLESDVAIAPRRVISSRWHFHAECISNVVAG